ncbi:MAG: response regulator transcription factor [Thermoleophilia bacterium]|jgi:DNA-binding response OmpR family regulator|nr:response regulator transcription factor [Thermoleophilia bacterium]MBJ7334961.1 response regulator transcription factor [Thermoleophilia bacterium]
MATVLIVEDDEVLAGVMRRHLSKAGHDVEWAADGERGLRKIRFERPDVCVVDLMMPGTDGWGLIEQIRAEGVTTPVIVLSARSSEHDKVHTLGIGADDYLVKPASMRELVARVDAALRRSGRTPPAAPERDEAPLEAPGIRIDFRTHRALIELAPGSWIDAELTVREFRLLVTLARERGRVLSRDELQQRVWGSPHRPRDRIVDVCVRKLREKLDMRSPEYSFIQTHYGVGYRFEPEAKAATPAT